MEAERGQPAGGELLSGPGGDHQQGAVPIDE